MTYAYAQTQGSSASTNASTIAGLLPIFLVFIVFYVLLIRPQQKKQKEHAQMLTRLKRNDEVVTSGGIYGTIVNVKDDTVILRVDDNVKIEVQKGAVAYIKKAASEN